MSVKYAQTSILSGFKFKIFEDHDMLKVYRRKRWEKDTL